MHSGFWKCLKVAVVAVALGPAGAMADDAAPVHSHNLFTIHDVAVDATARSAALARSQAIRQGERRAFRALLERLVHEDHVERLAGLDASAVSNLVHGLQFSNERSSQVRYMADMTLSFNAGDVRTLLRDAQAPYTETPGTPLLVVPVLDRDGARLLWEKENVWFDAWAEQDIANLLLPYVLPAGSMTDRMTLTTHQALAARGDQRRVMAGNYGMLGVFVPVAAVERNLRKDGVRVTVEWLHDGMNLLPEGAGDGPVRMTFESRDGESVADTLGRAAAHTIAMRDRIWKQQTMIRLDQTREIDVRIPLRAINDWSRIRQNLDRINLVQSVTLETMSVG
ncbi:MAG: DUF2066 domain-containing protein, partial [Sphingomonadales bacterium]